MNRQGHGEIRPGSNLQKQVGLARELALPAVAGKFGAAACASMSPATAT
jgi:hypothetical protein